MKLNFTLCNQDHFRYLQLRNFYDSEGKPSVNLDKNNLITALVGIYSSKKYLLIVKAFSFTYCPLGRRLGIASRSPCW